MSVFGLMGWNGPSEPLQDGHYFYPHDDKRTRHAFFASTFAIMGYLAKSDGRVCEDEISVAEKVMERMQLTLKQKQLAIELFNYGKSVPLDLEKIFGRLRKDVERRALIRQFIEIQLLIAYSDGETNDTEQTIIKTMLNELEFNRLEFEHLEREVKNTLLDPLRLSLHEAYRLLGVHAESSIEEMKKVYRRLIGQYHPDRMQAGTHSEEELREAANKAHQIKLAYEQVRKVKGF